MQWLLSALSALWQWWNHDRVSVKTASVYVLLLSAICYLLGSYRPQAAYHHLEQSLQTSRQDMRGFANEIARRNGQMNNLRARDNLNKKTIALLGDRIENLETENIQRQEEVAFYRHVLESNTATGGEIIIHALEANPDFARQEWKINAILARPGKRKRFQGSYYFEVVYAGDSGQHVLLRLPPQGEQPFEMNLYHEIEMPLTTLPTTHTIEELRVVILNSKGAHVAALETGSLNNGNNGGNGGNNTSRDNGDLSDETPIRQTPDGS